MLGVFAIWGLLFIPMMIGCLCCDGFPTSNCGGCAVPTEMRIILSGISDDTFGADCSDLNGTHDLALSAEPGSSCGYRIDITGGALEFKIVGINTVDFGTCEWTSQGADVRRIDNTETYVEWRLTGLSDPTATTAGPWSLTLTDEPDPNVCQGWADPQSIEATP